MTSKNNNRAFFCISPGNKEFSTKNVLGPIRSVVSENSYIVFLIADALRVYNKADTCSVDVSIGDLIDRFRFKDNTFSDRRRWLFKIMDEIIDMDIEYTILGMNDICDNTFFKIYRRLVISSHIDSSFSYDMKEAIERFNSYDQSSNMSWHYIMEEICANIRLRPYRRLNNEYYIGKYHKPLIDIYSGKYSFGISDVADAPHKMKYSFYSLSASTNGNKYWSDYSTY